MGCPSPVLEGDSDTDVKGCSCRELGVGPCVVAAGDVPRWLRVGEWWLFPGLQLLSSEHHMTVTDEVRQ
jgi:hypothetical protein